MKCQCEICVEGQDTAKKIRIKWLNVFDRLLLFLYGFIFGIIIERWILS
jgi:hypothetical protein